MHGRRKEMKKKEKKEKKSNSAVKTALIKGDDSLESLLAKADEAYTGLVKRYATLADVYVKIIRIHGNQGREAFKARFPLTENTLANLERVGTGRLLPQFTLCSNRFTSCLVRMRDSLAWQYKLVNSSEDGKVNVFVNGKVKSVDIGEIASNDVAGCILTLMSESDLRMTDEEFRDKMAAVRAECVGKFEGVKTPVFRTCIVNGSVCVKFLRAVPLTPGDLRRYADDLEAGVLRTPRP